MDEPTPIEPDAGGDAVDGGVEHLPDGLATAGVDAASPSSGLARRGLLVLGAFAVVVLGAIAFALAGGGGEGDGAATESDSTVDGDGSDEDTGADDIESEGATAEESDDAAADDMVEEGETSASLDMDDGFIDYGGEAPIAWGDGFLSIRQEFVPSDTTLPDLIPDLADRFPPEVSEVMDAAGIDLAEPDAIDRAIEALNDAGLYDEVAAVFLDDPELMGAYSEVLSGGTYVQVAEYSPDGLTWEAVDFAFDVPENAWPEYRSNGEQLLAVVTNNSWGPDGQRLDFSVTVHMSSDLVTWTSVDVPFELPDAPAHVQVDGWTDQIAIGPNGWYLGMSIHQYVDLWAVLPERIQNGEYSWSPAPEGVRIEDWQALYEAEMAASEDGDDEALEAMEPEVIEVIPWDDLPLTYGEWLDANNAGSDTRQAFVGSFDGTVASATGPDGVDWYQVAGTGEGFLAWGQLHTPSELTMQDLIPDIEERFPAEIIDAFADAGLEVGDVESIDVAMEFLAEVGLLDLATETVTNDPELLDAYTQVTSGGTYETVAFFSADGSSWSEVTFPDVQWADTIAPVQGGIVLLASSEDGGQEFWLGDARGTSWEQVDGPDLGEHQWFWFDQRSSGSQGLATVIDAGESHGPTYLAWSATVEHDGFELTMSADGEGFQTLTIVETATGEVRRDTTIEIWSEELFVWGEESFDFLDDDGEPIVSLPMEAGEDLIWRAESEAWDAWHRANPYQPDLTLVATIDGRDWVVQKLDAAANPDGWYGGGGAAINGGVVVYRDAAGWQRVVVG